MSRSATPRIVACSLAVKRRIPILCGFVLLCAGIGLWFALERLSLEVRDRALAWAEARRTEGWRIAHGPAQRLSLLPVIRWRIGNAVVRPPDFDPVSLAEVILIYDPLRWDAVRIEAPKGGRSGNVAAEFITVGIGDLFGDGHKPTRVEAVDPTAYGVQASGLQVIWSARDRISLEAQELRTTLPGLRRVWTRGRAKVRITPDVELLFSDPHLWGGTGGRAEIEQLELNRGRIRIFAEGGFGLDAEMKPEGRLVVGVTDSGFLEDFVDAGLLRPGQRSLVHAALAFLRGKDGVSRITLTAKRGVLRLGPIALARF